MIVRVIGSGLMALIAGCCCLGGCVPSEVAEPAHLRQGARVDQDVADRPRFETEPEDNQPEPPTEKIEVVEEHWPGGAIRLRREIKLDEKGEPVPHGVTTKWWESGEKKSELWFVNGIRHGPRLAWYRTGQTWSEGAYQHGKASGTWTVWDREGKREREWSYDDAGAYHHMFTLWHTNGTKRMEFEFDHGQKQGFETVWDEAGNIVLEIDYGRNSDE